MGKRKPSFSEELLNLFNRFSSEKIPFLIVGGIALALHGIPRSTLDIDIFIRITLYVASLEDLEVIKRASGRPIDYADIALIQERLKLNNIC